MQKKFYAHKELHTGWMKDPKYRSEYQSLEPEFQIAKQIMAARIRQKLTQKELAKKVGTGQAVISRLESMNSKPSLSLLSRVARALDTKLQITVQ
ncbi:MAG: Transcriptional regulator, XRE family [Candidatus Gottesmanbacteria bacterium GW2011_GWB1_43_11]|uniref:Transcriptional regulator, XRE family n=1 Tax=Candidatus Gottesmanbacteria bacterium GW2011_GWB1_43_11 TaxID=1618446 RepID=A0A0G1FD56_9BACT|nr:MAG: Transcriptional regulator, XRE family [Candidatus Gottesmanbacteria bacterium GW2011_GWA2_42_16]KKS54366.1 MAG: Transcriptional regulator, XRE family [Candidatus Gottesmanbacteria bacterium GW2011_GWA1_42_26]KKS80233.1 MAG: transcriptional regulator, XRE family [Candidatus Gottesmanbacteria bacterium GW2011_GWC1_43_10]KKS84793.1 MAG: Transcriptional regulator, XRE family [Candidatus Gottesmanbacteria bacterium GW2011_GWB1_43_11]OGG10571.1 MAG: hypothetical protein A2699_03530 [Candidatu